MHLILERSLGMLLKSGWVLERDGRYHISDEGRSALGSLNDVMLSRMYKAGPFSLSGAQVVCVVTGFSLLHLGRMLLHRAGHAIHHARKHGSDRPYFLVTDGPYAVRRHPMYRGIILINMGIGIGLHSVYTCS